MKLLFSIPTSDIQNYSPNLPLFGPHFAILSGTQVFSRCFLDFSIIVVVVFVVVVVVWLFFFLLVHYWRYVIKKVLIIRLL